MLRDLVVEDGPVAAERDGREDDQRRQQEDCDGRDQMDGTPAAPRHSNADGRNTDMISAIISSRLLKRLSS
jgi:hypothetical protein